MSRLIAIGDIHGMADPLRKLIDKIIPTSQDNIVCLGDYINRGPDSKGVLDTLLELDKTCKVNFILGNHEEYLLAATTSRDAFRQWLKFGGDVALRSWGITPPFTAMSPFDYRQLPADHLRLLAALQQFHETDGHIFVHAGLLARIPMHQQSSEDLRWRTPVEGLRHCSGKIVVCGHSPHPYAVRVGGLWHVDTGAGVRRDGKLSAVDVLTGKIWMVDAGIPVG